MSPRAWRSALIAAVVSWLVLFVLIFGVAAAFAGPITGCVTSLPTTFSFASAHHLQVGAWEDAAGCLPSGPNARPTAGPYEREFFADGSQGVTMFAALFNTCGSTQMDIREVNDLGQIVGYHDFIYNTGVECSRAMHGDVDVSGERVAQPLLVPEPASVGLFGLGLAWVLQRRTRR